MYFRCSKQEQGEQHGILDMMVSFPDLMSANKTNYRIVNGYTVPYIKLSFDKHCLSYATVGPLNCGDEHKKTQVDVLEVSLSAGGYTAIGQHSNIPVRY